MSRTDGTRCMATAEMEGSNRHERQVEEGGERRRTTDEGGAHTHRPVAALLPLTPITAADSVEGNRGERRLVDRKWSRDADGEGRITRQVTAREEGVSESDDARCDESGCVCGVGDERRAVELHGRDPPAFERPKVTAHTADSTPPPWPRSTTLLYTTTHGACAAPLLHSLFLLPCCTATLPRLFPPSASSLLPLLCARLHRVGRQAYSWTRWRGRLRCRWAASCA